MLGPMVNPSAPKNQMVGVFNLELLRLYAYLYQDSDKNYSIIHDLGGYDEISLTNTVKIVSNKSEVLFSAKDLGLKIIPKKPFLAEIPLQRPLKFLKK